MSERKKNLPTYEELESWLRELPCLSSTIDIHLSMSDFYEIMLSRERKDVSDFWTVTMSAKRLEIAHNCKFHTHYLPNAEITFSVDNPMLETVLLWISGIYRGKGEA